MAGEKITCPHCGLPSAAGTNCENCGEKLDPNAVTRTGTQEKRPDDSGQEKGNRPGPEKGNAATVACATCGEQRPVSGGPCPNCGVK